MTGTHRDRGRGRGREKKQRQAWSLSQTFRVLKKRGREGGGVATRSKTDTLPCRSTRLCARTRAHSLSHLDDGVLALHGMSAFENRAGGFLCACEAASRCGATNEYGGEQQQQQQGVGLGVGVRGGSLGVG